jgi:beta-N-acetylhexosaminidase
MSCDICVSRFLPSSEVVSKREKGLITIRVYDPHNDSAQVYALWQQALGHLWPLTYETFHTVTVDNSAYRPGDHMVALAGDEIVGFLATQIRRGTPPPQGNLLLLLVAPTFQRQGIGRMLHEQALTRLKLQGVAEVQLGGGFHYFWQGVPLKLPEAWSFFQAQGWTEQERSFDLMRTLADYTTPKGVYEHLRPTLTIRHATLTDAPAILVFEEQHFPRWLAHYQRVLDHQGYADIVIAEEIYQGVVGTSFVVDPHAVWWQSHIRWLTLLGDKTGGIGPLGVAEHMRREGIGLALAARITETLCQRGLTNSYIGWTWLVEWYGKLGYQIWQEYIMAWRKI